MVTKAQKDVTIEELKVKFGDAKAVYATTQKGLTVKEISALRRLLRTHKAEYKIAKNTLIGKASVGTAYEQVGAELHGPTALVFCYDDAVAPIGEVKTFSKEIENKIEMVSGLLDGEYLDVTKLNKLANLPGKKVLLSQIAGMLVQPTSMIAYILKELSEKGEGKTLRDFLVANSNQASQGSEEPEAKAESVETEAAAQTPEEEKKEGE
jgi:large subunit ribosomal protein L10